MNTDELYQLTRQEIKQREEEGCDVSGLREKHAATAELEDPAKREASESLLAELEDLTPNPKYVEPSDLAAIGEQRPDGPRRMQNLFSTEDLFTRTYGAWLGRCAGCLLGKPVEGWARAEIRAVAEPDGNYPLADYFAAVTQPVGRRALASTNPCLRGQITRMERDDDIDYTVAGLLLLERHGYDFTTEDVAGFWLAELPFHKVYTAERVAYRNLVAGVPPSEAGGHRNPCREWIGAQIRADSLGYACPGWPEGAAELAYRDAYVSHRKNGIYGEMLVAAMIAAAFVEPDAATIIEIGLSEIPEASRLAEAVRRVVKWWHETEEWESVADHIDEHYGDLQGCHTITNAAIVVLGLLAGAEDFTAGIAASIMPGYDTDCNGATVGSILGARCGADGLPAHWVEPLNDRLATIIASVHEARISDMARRTVRLVEGDLGESAVGGAVEPITWGVS
jgi:ADP-ribosylglycohydrolase